MTALPSVSAAISASATEGDLKTFLLNQYNYLAGLFGTDGNKATAKAALDIAEGVTSLNGNTGAVTAAQVAAAATAGYGYTPAKTDVGVTGVGAFCYLSCTGGPVASGSVVSGSTVTFGGVSPPGSWRNIMNKDLALNNNGMFQRIA